MREIHDRMPVILDSSVLEDWLNPEIHEREILRELLQPCPDQWLSATEVSSLVNSPQNNSPEVLQPAGTVVASGAPQRRLFEV
jgi:putative SOS response-associated peptidase YedK